MLLLILCTEYVVLLKNGVGIQSTNEVKAMVGEDRITKHNFFGFNATIDEETRKKLEKSPHVEIVERNSEISIASKLFVRNFIQLRKISLIKQTNAPWNLDRINGSQYINFGGENVTVYVLDTGVDVNHDEFENRAVFAHNVVDTVNDDLHGHGTHVAGIVAGKTFGIAKKARIKAVKILDSTGRGLISQILEGLEFVIKDLKEGTKAVVNMSVGGTNSRAVNYAVNYLSKLGIHFSVAAGNDDLDACLFSPASSKNAVTVGATNQDNLIADFSNKGKCVDIYAPGTDITSSWKNNQIMTISGTSMSTPHIAGMMAVYLSMADFEPKELASKLIEDSVMVRDLNIASLLKLYERIRSN